MENNYLIKTLLNEIKKNKKYKTIADAVIIDEIRNYLRANKIEEIAKQDIKNIRAVLHKFYSSYQTKKKRKKYFYLEQLRKNPKSREIINKLLSMTLSTKERLKDYILIYNRIFEKTGKPETIIDLGAGLNPLSYNYMDLRKLNYYAYDIDEEDIKFINEYFNLMKQKGLRGMAKILDIRKTDSIKKLPRADVAFLFKIIDLIDSENHKPSEELIKELIKKTKFIIASFATKTITRRFMNYPDRKWFELMLERNNLQFQKFNTDNELFYIINHKNY